MNKNKIFFAIIGAILLFFVIYLVMNLANSNQRPVTSGAGNLLIWTMDDDENAFNSITASFKAKYPQYASKNIKVESFDDAISYQNALTNAFLQGTGPDIFALHNTENSVLENAVRVIPSSKLSPNDFRLSFKPIFSEDLIISDQENLSTEYVVGVPFGYESLGLIYNRKYFPRPSELETWSGIISAMKANADRSNTIIPLGLGNASGVERYTSIIMSFLGLEGADSLISTTSNQVKQVFSFYKAFAEISGDNKYEVLSSPLIQKTDIDFFTQGDVGAILGFPRDIMKIDEIGYQSSLLYASGFPQYAGSEKVQSIEYKYFVLNTNSKNSTFAEDFLVYLASSEGQREISTTFPYYLPAHIDVETELLEKKIFPEYNIVYKNFIIENAKQISFNVADRTLFHQEIYPIGEITSGFEKYFSDSQKYIICSNTKSTSLLNLSSPCLK